MEPTREGAFFRTVVEPELLMKTGEFMRTWGELDFVSLLLLQRLEGLSWFQVEDRYGGEQTRRRIDSLRKLFDEYSDSFSKEITPPKSLKKHFNKISSTRNALAHGVWMLVKSKNGYEPVCAHIGRANEYVTKERLHQHSKLLSDLVRELANVWIGFGSFDEISEMPGLFLGMGTPEGEVAAPVGSVYFDLQEMGRKMPNV